VAYARSSRDGLWRLFDDDDVHVVDTSQARKKLRSKREHHIHEPPKGAWQRGFALKVTFKCLKGNPK